MPSNTWPRFSQEQITQYFDRIHLPQDARLYSVADLSASDTLKYLAKLQRHNLASIPFENLAIHYSVTGNIDLNADALFRKIVLTSGRGGYCMENNLLFGVLLRSLGFTVYSGGARIWAGAWMGWAHMVNFITIDGVKYVVDVGFGSSGQTAPLPLTRPSVTAVAVAPAQHRLVWTNLDDNDDPDQKFWVFQHRYKEGGNWMPLYCFTELEFLPVDYAIMSLYTSTSRRVIFTQMIICVRMVFGREVGLYEQAEDIVGSLILHQTKLKRRINGVTETLQEFASEAERLEALKQNFNIEFSPEEKGGIMGMVTAIEPGFEP